MRAAAFVILSCALQYVTSEIIEEKIHNILSDENKYETKNETTSDEFEIDQNGKIFEKQTIHKEFLLKNDYDSDLDEGGVKITRVCITNDGKGHERIIEDDTIIKKVPEITENGNIGSPVTSVSLSSASASSKTPESNSSVATGSAASASTAAKSNASSGGIATVAGTRGVASGQSAAVAAADNNGRTYGNSYGPTSIDGTNSSQETHIIIPLSLSSSSAATSVARENLSGKKEPTTGDKTIEVTPALNAGNHENGSKGSGPHRLYGSQDPEKIIIKNLNYPGLEPAGSPDASKTTKKDVSKTPRPKNEPRYKTLGGVDGNNQNRLISDFDGPDNGKYNVESQEIQSYIKNNNDGLETSSYAASATTRGAGSASSAASVAGTQGPESRSTSAVSTSITRSDAVRPGNISATQVSSGGSEGGSIYLPHGNQRPKEVYYYYTQEPGSGLSDSPGASPIKQGDTTGKQQPESVPVSKPAGTTTRKSQTGLDFSVPRFSSVISSAAAGATTRGAGSVSSAASAAGTHSPASGSTSDASSTNTRSGAGGPGKISGTHGSFDLYQPDYSSVISTAAASATTRGAGSASSAASVAGTQGPESRSTSAVSTSITRSDAVRPGNISATQVSSGGSEGGSIYLPHGNQRPKEVYYYYTQEPGSGLSDSPGASPIKQGDTTGKQQPESVPVSKPAGTTTRKSQTGLDFSVPRFSSVISSAAAGATTRGAGSVSSAASAAGTHSPASGSTSDASSTNTRSGAGGPGKISGTHGSFDLYQPDYSSVISTAAASATTRGAGSASSAASVAGTQGPESRSTSAVSTSITRSDAVRPGNISATQVSSGGSEGGSIYLPHGNQRPKEVYYYYTQEPGSGLSDSPGASPIKQGDTTGKQQPESVPVSKPAGTTTRKSQTGLDFSVPRFSSVISSAAAGATTRGAGSASSATSVAGPQGPESDSTSAASTSITRSDTDDSGIISGTKRSFGRSEEGETYENGSEGGGVNLPYGNQRLKELYYYYTQEPGSGLSDLPGASAIKQGGTTGTQRPDSRPVSKPAGTTTRKRQTGLDFSVPRFSSVISSAAAGATTRGAGSVSSAASAAGTHSPASGSPSDASSTNTRSDTDDSGIISGTKRSFGRSEKGGAYENGSEGGGVNLLYGNQRPRELYYYYTQEPGSGLSDLPGASAIKQGGTTGTQRPDSRPVSKPAGTTTRKRQTGLDFSVPRFSSVISSAAAGATTRGAGSVSSAASAAGTHSPASGSTSDASSTNTRSGAGGPGKISGTHGSFDLYQPDYSSVISTAAASATTRGAGSASSATSVAGPQGPESDSTSAASTSITRSDTDDSGIISGTKRSFGRSEEGETYENGSEGGGVNLPYGNQRLKELYYYYTQEPGSGLSDLPGASAIKQGGTTGTQRPDSRPVSKPAGTTTRKRQTGLDFSVPRFSSVISSAAAGATTRGAGSVSSAASAAGTHSPASGSPSDASSTNTRSDTDDSGIISGTKRSFGRSEKGGAYENGSEGGGVNLLYGNQRPRELYYYYTQEPGSGLSDLPGASAIKQGGTTGTQRPDSRPVSKPAGTTTRKRQTGLDFSVPRFSSVISSAAAGATTRGAGSVSSAASAAGTHSPASGSTSDASSTNTRSGAGGPGKISGTHGSFDLYQPDYSSVISTAAASATTRGAGSASSAASVAGTQGPESRSTSAVSTSITRSDAVRPGNISATQVSSGGSEGGSIYLPHGNQRPKEVYYYYTQEPGSGLSDSPGASPIKQGDTTGKQQPESVPVSKPAGTTTRKSQTGLDFSVPRFSSVISSAAAGATTRGAGSVSSAASAAGTHSPASGSTSDASSTNTRSGAGGPGKISGTHGSFDLYQPDYSSVISTAAASATTRGAGSASSATSVAGPQGPESDSTSAASTSITRSDTDDSGIISGTKRSFGRSEEGETYENGSEGGGVNLPYGNQRLKELYYYYTQEPGSGLSDLPGASAIKQGGTTGTQRPDSRPVSKPAGTTTRKRQTGLDFSVPRFSSVISSAAAGATTRGAGSVSSAASAAGTHSPASGSTSDASSTNTRSGAGGPGKISGTHGSFDLYQPDYSSVISTAAASATTRGAGSASSATSVAGPQGPESDSTSAASTSITRSDTDDSGIISGTKRSFGRSEEGETYENGSEGGGVNLPYGNQRLKELYYYYTQEPGSGLSDLPGASAIKQGGTTGTQRPDSRPVSKPAGTTTRKRQTGLDFSVPRFSSVISSAAAGATTRGAGYVSSAASAAGTHSPASGSTSDASSTNTRSGADDSGIISGTKRSFGRSEECGAYENGSEGGGVNLLYGNQRPKELYYYYTQEPGSGLSDLPGASAIKQGGTTGTQRPDSRTVSKPAGTTTRKRQTGLDFSVPGFSSVISSAAAGATTRGAGSVSSAASAAGTHSPASGSTSDASSTNTRSGAGGPGKISGTHGSFDLYQPDYSSVISTAAASATTRGAGSASSVTSVAGPQGPESDSTSAASTSITRSDTDDSGIISGTKRSFGRSEEGETYENGSEGGGVNLPYGNQRLKELYYYYTQEPGSGLSDLPGASAIKQGGTTGTQRPDSRPVSKPAGTTTRKRQTGLDFSVPRFSSVISSAAAGATTRGAGSVSSAASAAGTHSPASGSTSDASSTNTRSGADDSGIISGTKRSFGRSEECGAYENGSEGGGVNLLYGNQRPKELYYYYTQEPGSGLSDSPGASPIKQGGTTGTQRPESRLVSKPAGTTTGKRQTGLDFSVPGFSSAVSSAAAGATTRGAGSASSAASAAGTHSPASGSTSDASSSYTRSVAGGPVSISGSHGSFDFFRQGYSSVTNSEELPTIYDNKRGSESSSSPAVRASAGELAAGIPDTAPTTSGVASGVTSGQGSKRTCRLRSSQFVLRLGRKGQPCTFCY